MASFKKSTSINGKFKNVVCTGDSFVDEETGEEIDLADILYKIYGGASIDISTSYKEDTDIG